MNIPFVNLRLQYESIKEEIDSAVADVFTESQFIGGGAVKKFEDEFSKLHQVKNTISTGNGTDSLYITLKALGIGAGDEVITPAFSCIASAEVITLAGAKPVFADVNSSYYTIDPANVERKITPKTKAIIAVHLYGQAAPVTRLQEICAKHNLFLIEDCAQAHLTKENEKLVGTFGVAAAFSFYPTKNLGAYGDAGCILTQDDALAERMRRISNHGALQKDDHAFEATNSRMDSIQAAALSAKLRYIRQWNERRFEIANLYNNLLKSCIELILPAARPNTTHTFHIYGIRTVRRDSLKKFLESNGITTMIHYPKGLPFTKAYEYLGHKPQDFLITSQLQDEQLSLPIFPELTDEEVTYIATNILNYFSR